jgi:hypothetical protein
MTIIYYKNNDEFKSTEINVWSGNFQKDESMIWSHYEQKGFLQKHFSKIYAITNFRVFTYDFEINKMTGLLMMYDLDDIVVTDTYRSYNSIRYGAYGYGMSGGQSRGQSVSMGKIIFMSSGKPIISLNGVTDPNGLKRLTLSVKKALYPKKELQRFLTGVKDDNLSIVRNVSICLRCNTRNVKDASFCSSCGSILK